MKFPDEEIDEMRSQQATLEKATRYVTDLWFPVSDVFLGKVQQDLKKGVFKDDIGALVAEVSGDFSLYLYCLKELVRMVKDEEDIEVPSMLSPSKLLEWGGFERLRKIIETPSREISPHSLKQISPSQLTRYQETMISSSASESLAGSYAVDPDLAYTAALLRQLGYTLIAWNYPVVYQKAVAEFSKGVPLDLSLTQMFGFSPTSLALSVVRDWGLPESLIMSLSKDDPKLDTEWGDKQEARAISDTLVSICKVGEALARANNPAQFNSAQSDWEFSKAVIQKALGQKGMAFIQEKLAEHCLQLADGLPHIFNPGFVLDPEGKISAHVHETMLARNPYVVQSRAFLKEKLEALYTSLRPSQVSRENLTKLARDIIPTAGFVSGCVFSVEPNLSLLVPQLAVGKSNLKSFSSIEYQQYQKPPADEGILWVVLESFREGTVVTTRTADSECRAVVGISGPIGQSQRVGVLYLEIGELMYEDGATQHMTHFKALLQAFNDCLALT